MARDIIALDDLTVNNLGTFKKINEVTLPSRYDSNWYKEALSTTNQITKLAFYAEIPVGAIKAKAFNNTHKINSLSSLLQFQLPSKNVPNAMYIESFAVLEKYRGLGIGSKLLEFIIDETKKRFIHEIIIHVHVDNVDAVEWYLKKGFVKKEEIVQDYYKDLDLNNPNAYIMTLSV
ncbi:N-terminal acetyltransferase A complex subunit NAT5 [Spathaspora sp. JA1]|nr:N-terminal acetyltransferase A complex subunit NAT5 [Spathaspora sp. JA1]